MRGVRLTDEQMVAIETAITTALECEGKPLRAGQLERHPRVVKVLGALPAGKSDMRHIDSALQRMRRAEVIVHTAKGWRLA